MINTRNVSRKLEEVYEWMSSLVEAIRTFIPEMIYGQRFHKLHAVYTSIRNKLSSIGMSKTVAAPGIQYINIFQKNKER